MAQIQIIFPIYELQFYRYLRPWVVDDIRKKRTFNHDKELRLSVKSYFDFMFPIETYPRIKVGKKELIAKPNEESQRDIVWKDISKYVYQHNWLDEMKNNYTAPDFYPLIDEVTNQEFPKDYMNEVNKLRDEILIRPLIGIIDDKLKQKTKLTYPEFRTLKDVTKLHLTNEIIKKGFKIYDKKWEQKIKDENYEKQPHVTRPKAQNAKEYIKYNIIATEQPDEVKKLDEIYDLVFDRMNKNETREQLYKYYLDERNNHFKRSSFQLSAYKQKFPVEDNNYKTLTQRKEIPNYFPLKENLKRYKLHAIAPRFSYLIDLMFENRKLCYLVAININTRKLWVEPTNIKIVENDTDDDQTLEYKIIEQMKNSKVYIDALQQMIKKGMKVKFLKGDGEKAFDSKKAHSFYDNNPYGKIKFEPVKMRQQTKYPDFMNELNMVKKLKNKSDPNHSSLAIIDRAIRTIREIAFHLQVGMITPRIMEYIVFLYNNTPHNTLSKYAGIKVTPNEVDEKPELEKFIVRKIQQENFNTMQQFGFDIPIGDEVLVYNVNNNMAKRRSVIEPDTWRIKQRLGNLYEIERTDKIEKPRTISRFKLHPKDLPYQLY